MSREKKWTPGPWVARYHDRVATADDTDGTKSIAHIYTWRNDTLGHRPNQTLIAAAPDLVESAEALINSVMARYGLNSADELTCQYMRDLAKSVDKAYGETK